MTPQQDLRLFVHVEEPSMAAALDALLPRMLQGKSCAFKIIDHGSKSALLNDVPARLRGYALRRSEDIRVMVLVDRDNDDCRMLKALLERAAVAAGLPTKTAPGQDGRFHVVNRIVIEELEAWFVGDVAALRAAYSGVPETLANRARFRDPDAVPGGTWEALHRVLVAAGHYAGLDRMPKIEVARQVALHMEPANNRSKSFQVFASGLAALAG